MTGPHTLPHLEPDRLTLSTFFEQVYRPYVLVGGSPRTVQAYRESLKHWRRHTGDPLLAELSGQPGQELIARFRSVLLESDGRHRTLSRETVNKLLRHIRALVRKAGPRRPENPEGFDLIPDPPFVRMFKTHRRYFRRLTLTELSALYDACGRAAYMPVLDGIEPGDWWRAFLVTAYGTALRLGALLAARLDKIDWQERTLMVSGDKTGH